MSSRSKVLVAAGSLIALSLVSVFSFQFGQSVGLATMKPAPGVEEVANVVKAAESIIGTKVDDVRLTPVPDLLEVISGGVVVYMDRTGKFFMDGQMVDVDTKTSLTNKTLSSLAPAAPAADKDQLPAFDPAELNFADAIKTVYGKETPGRVLVTFEDPRCKYCRQLNAEMQGLKDVVVYTFPVSFLGEESRAMNEAIWGEADRSKAWHHVMQGKPYNVATKQPARDVVALDRNTLLARGLKVSGTPTVFTSTGERLVGAVGLDVLEAAIQRAQKS